MLGTSLYASHEYPDADFEIEDGSIEFKILRSLAQGQ